MKAALDADWDDPAARDQALAQVLGFFDLVEAFVAGQAGEQAAATAVVAARQIRDQDVDLTGPAPALRRGVAKHWRISIEDGDMRHGRNSSAVDTCPGHSASCTATSMLRPLAPALVAP